MFLPFLVARIRSRDYCRKYKSICSMEDFFFSPNPPKFNLSIELEMIFCNDLRFISLTFIVLSKLKVCKRELYSVKTCLNLCYDLPKIVFIYGILKLTN